jgi:hypothetical protein
VTDRRLFVLPALESVQPSILARQHSRRGEQWSGLIMTRMSIDNRLTARLTLVDENIRLENQRRRF